MLRCVALVSALFVSTAASAASSESVVRLFTCSTGDHDGRETRSLNASIFLALDAQLKPVRLYGSSLYEKHLIDEEAPSIQILEQHNAKVLGSVKSLKINGNVVEIKLGNDGYAEEGSDLYRQGVNMKAKTVLIVDGQNPKAKIFGVGGIDQIVMDAGFDCQVESLKLLKKLGN